MAKQTKGQGLLALAKELAGIPEPDTGYVGKLVYGRKGSEFAAVAGKVTNVSGCRLEGCSGLRLHVLWPGGKRTYPCAKGCGERPDKNLEIL